MVRKQETKKKLKPKTVKVTSKAKPRKYARKNSINSSSISISSTSLNYTLPEGNHLDSFDQFLVDGKRKLRSENALKKDIRASFNRDSSIEYDSDEQSLDQSSTIASEPSPQLIESIEEQNVDPKAEQKFVYHGITVNSSNSWMFSRSVRRRRRHQKALSLQNSSAIKRNHGPFARLSTLAASTPTQEPKQITKWRRISGVHIKGAPLSSPVEDDPNLIVIQKDIFPSSSSEESTVEQSAADQSEAEQSKAAQTGAEQSEVEQSEVEKSKTEKIFVTPLTPKKVRPAPKRLHYTTITDNSSYDVAHVNPAIGNEDTFTTPTSSAFDLNDVSHISIVDEFEESDKPSYFSIPDNDEAHSSFNSFSHGESNLPRSTSFGPSQIDGDDELSHISKSDESDIRHFTKPFTKNRSKSANKTKDIDISDKLVPAIRDDKSFFRNRVSTRRPRRILTPRLSSLHKKTDISAISIDSINKSSHKENETVDESEKDYQISSKLFETTDAAGNTSSHTELSTENHSVSINESLENDQNAAATGIAVDVITVSSTESGDHLLPVTSISKIPSPKPSNKVGFGDKDSIHEMSIDLHSSTSSESNHKIVIKGGKWRRTIYDIRKAKVTNSPRVTLERPSTSTKQPKTSIRGSRAFVIRRKSIFVKDIGDRKTIHEPRKPSQNLVVLDESDVESICSSDFSPKPRSINVLSAKLRSSRRLLQNPIADCVDFVGKRGHRSLYDRSHTGSQLSLCTTSSGASIVDELEDLTSSLNLGYNQQELKAQLLKRCGQTNVLPFDDVYSPRILKKCRKIGEGVFGEVFLNEISARSSYVLKIIPIEGDEEINGAQQKRFHEILQEIIISQELSALRYGKTNSSAGFVEVLNVRLVEGRYPAHLLKLWHDYEICVSSENDCPDVFGDDQLYVVFELANCGLDLEANIFKNAEQSFSVFKQVAISLAVAESEFQFEHRDLHWGNVLVTPTTDKYLTYSLNGKPIELPSHGVKATIIDYTLSRLVYKHQCLFQDLAADPELFEAGGDYQYDIYRLMRTQTNNYWEVFEPFTNILWLHYTLDKMIDGVRYSARRAVKHRQAIDDMMKLRDELLEYRSAADYAETSH